MDISAIATADLKDLLDRIPAELKRREKEDKAKARKEIEAIAAAHGFSLDDLLGGVSEPKVKKAVAVKYRHPENADLAWTGRGRQPKWVADFIISGGNLEQLLV